MPPAALESRIRALEDREAIRDLIARYGPLADAGDAAGVAALWTGDGEYRVEGFASAEGRDRIAGLINDEHHRQLMADGCAHMLGPVAIVVDGDGAVATGHSIVVRHGESGFAVLRASANRWELERTGSGWRVKRRVNALLDGNEAARLLLAACAERGQNLTPTVAEKRRGSLK